MGIYKVPMSYGDILTEEETITVIIGISNVEISVSPIPDTIHALITIVENGEALILNRLCTTNEYVLEKYVFPSGFIGDFSFLFSGKGSGSFDINRLGSDLFLAYTDGEDYED